MTTDAIDSAAAEAADPGARRRFRHAMPGADIQ
jgi:hypothetical protein